MVVATPPAVVVTSPVWAAWLALICPAVARSQVMVAVSVSTRSADSVASAVDVMYSAPTGAPEVMVEVRLPPLNANPVLTTTGDQVSMPLR